MVRSSRVVEAGGQYSCRAEIYNVTTGLNTIFILISLVFLNISFDFSTFVSAPIDLASLAILPCLLGIIV